MSLPSQVIDIPFTQGLDTKSDAKLTAKLARLENYQFRGGTLVKRYGGGVLPSTIAGGGSFTAGEAIESYGSELLRINGGSLYSYASGSSTWASRGFFGYTSTFASRRIVRSVGVGGAGSQAYNANNGISVYAWSTAPASLSVAVVDEATGAVYRNGETPISTGFIALQNVSCISVGSSVLVFAADSFTSTNLVCVVVNTNTPTASLSATTIRTDVASGSGQFDVVALGSFACVTYVNSTAGNNNLTSILVDSTGTVSSPTVLAATGTSGVSQVRLAVDSSSRLYVMALDSSNTLWYTVLSSSLALVLAKTTIGTSYSGGFTGVATGTTVTLFADGFGSNAALAVASINATGVSSSLTPIFATSGLTLASAATLYNSVPVVACEWSNVVSTSFTVQPSIFFVDASGNFFAKCLLGTAAIGGLTTLNLPRPVTIGSTVNFLLRERERLAYQSLSGFILDVTGLGLTRFSLTPTTANNLPLTRVGQSLYMGGALPRAYDGQHFSQAGFAVFPEPPKLTASSTAGNLSAGVYNWRCLFSWTNAKGELVRSAPGPVLTATLAASKQATFTIPNAMVTDMSNVQVEVYRTQANGTTYYRCSTVGALASSSSVSGQSYTDNLDDVSLLSGEVLYTTGGGFDNLGVPPYLYSCAWKNRLVIAGLENPYQVRYTGQAIDGQALRFNDNWSFYVPSETGGVTGIDVLDDKLVIFAERGIYVVYGDGPDLLGQNSTLSSPQQVASDTGCRTWQSIANYPDGILFLGNQGICQVTRGLEVEYIGADVEAYSSYNFRAVAVLGALDQVRFQVDQGNDVTSGIALVWDYFYKQWSISTGFGALNTTLYNNRYCRVRSDGAVYLEDTSRTDDNGTIPLGVIETAWIKTAGLQGFQRARRALLLGQQITGASFNWEVAYDYSATYNALDLDFINAQLGAVWAAGAFQTERHLRVQKCEAIRFRITFLGEVSGSGNGSGISFTGLALDVAMKQGRFRGLPASRRS